MTQNLPADIPASPGAERVAPPSGGKLRFGESHGFQAELRRRVEEFLNRNGRRIHDCPQLYLKAAIVLTIFTACYVFLVFVAQTWWQALPLAISLGLSMAAVGFNIQHDGSHHAFSNRKWVNRLTAMSLDLLGGSSYVWAIKHNVVHHSFANITGHDDDIDIGFFGRLSPHQKRMKIHALQHYYLWALYGFLPIKWQLYDDFQNVAVGRVGRRTFARPKGWDLVTFIGGKPTFLLLAFVIPLSLHPLWVVLPLYVAASFVQGVVLSVVFQLAHCVESAAFPLPTPSTGRMETAWAVHQIETTVNFAPHNRLLMVLIGGLNFQIEHHLFPRICHIHYRALAPLVEATCREFGVRYVAHDTFWSGIAAHYRWLRRMGNSAEAKAE